MNLPKLSDLFSLEQLQQALNDRHVVARHHPTLPLTILNYTETCQYSRNLWTPVTLQCRGLIHDVEGNVVARPFPKFFNYGEGGNFTLDTPVEVTDKLDGSLGIMYEYQGHRAIATRGSFASDQALHATTLLNTRYDYFKVPDGWTALFEIIYPENRIVLDYGSLDDLVLLGLVDLETGRSVGPNALGNMEWRGPRAEVLQYTTLRECIHAETRKNAEGMVVYFPQTNTRLKIKQADYVALHKIVTGLNERAVWQHLVDGKPLTDLLNAVPDEFHEWVKITGLAMCDKVQWASQQVEGYYMGLIQKLGLSNKTPESRKAFAMAIKDHSRKACLFKRLDGKDYRPLLWDEIYPAPLKGPRGLAPSEETA